MRIDIELDYRLHLLDASPKCTLTIPGDNTNAIAETGASVASRIGGEYMLTYLRARITLMLFPPLHRSHQHPRARIYLCIRTQQHAISGARVEVRTSPDDIMERLLVVNSPLSIYVLSICMHISSTIFPLFLSHCKHTHTHTHTRESDIILLWPVNYPWPEGDEIMTRDKIHTIIGTRLNVDSVLSYDTMRELE